MDHAIFHEDRERIKKLWYEQAKDSRTWNYEYRFCTPDSRITWVYGTAVALKDSKGVVTGYLGVHIDITQAKMFEQQFLDRNRRYQVLFEKNDDAMFFVDKKTQRIVDCNPKAERHVEKRADAIRECRLEELCPSIAKQMSIPVEDTVAVKYHESECLWKNSKHRICRWKVFSLDEDMLILQITDITEERRMHDDYKKLFSTMFDAFALHEMIFDEQGNPVNYRFLNVNPFFENITGLKASDIVGKTLLEVLPGSEEFWIQTYGRVVLTGESVHFEQYSGLLKKHFEVTAYKYGFNQFACLFKDITESKIARQQIAESEQYLQVIFDKAPIIMMLLNEKAEVLKINRMGSRWIEGVRYDGDMRCGHVMHCVNAGNHPDGCGFSIDCASCVIRKVLDDGLIYGVEYHKMEMPFCIENEQGQKKYTFLISTAIVKTGQQKQLLVSLDDITDRKIMEEEMLVAKEKAIESDRLKTAFLNNISHEIRTPMNGIVGFGEMLKKADLSNTSRNMYIDIIIKSSNRLMSIVDDIVAISRLDAGQEAIYEVETDVNAIISELELIYKKQIDPAFVKINISKTLPPDEAVILVDKIKLYQVLNNILGNATKFTRAGTIDISCKKAGDMLEFVVKDTGPGIAPHALNKIFERFWQENTGLSRDFGGTGLGLAISKGYVEIMGGKIWCESRMQVGSAFHVVIPYKLLQSAKKNRKEDMVNICPRWETKTLLLVEDESLNVAHIREVLTNTGITIVEAKTGQEAISLFTETPFDVVLLDIKLPDISGIEVVKKIKQINKAVPVIVNTAYAYQEDKERIMAAGCDDYLTKPVTYTLLLETMQRFLNT